MQFFTLFDLIPFTYLFLNLKDSSFFKYYFLLFDLKARYTEQQE